MKGISCSWVEEHLDEYLVESLPEERQAMVRVHIAVCDSCRESARIWSGLEAAAPTAEMRPLPPFVERRLLSGNPPEQRAAEPHPWRRFLTIAVPSAAAAAAATLLVLALTSDDPPAATEQPAPVAVSQHEDTPLVADATPEVADASRKVIRVLPGTALWLSDDARATVTSIDHSGVRFRLERGFAVAEVGPVEPGFRFVVATPTGEVEARGTVFSVQVADDGQERVRVAEGVVEVRRRDRRAPARILSAGQETGPQSPVPQAAPSEAIAADLAFLFGAAEPPAEPCAVAPKPEPTPIAAQIKPIAADTVAPKPLAEADQASDTKTPTTASAEPPPATEEVSGHDPESMVKLAQAYRSSRMFTAAARTYERLISKFPKTASARNSLVALGQLELTALGQPTAALGRFEDYLDRSKSGALAAEARIGRARALARLGRVTQLKVAARDYLEAHPTGRAAAEMHRRLGDAHRSSGACGQATAEYQLVIDRWPASKEAKRARNGLDTCSDVP
jgi:ferric-dicitrate binding protein FerR (iron transport regulator)/outer membrane protein assembly factor BamD (BamD/ComL family)